MLFYFQLKEVEQVIKMLLSSSIQDQTVQQYHSQIPQRHGIQSLVNKATCLQTLDGHLSTQLGYTVLRSKVHSEGIPNKEVLAPNTPKIGECTIAKGRFEYGPGAASWSCNIYNEEQGIFERGKIKII